MEKLITSSEIILVEELQNRLQSEGIDSQMVEDHGNIVNSNGSVMEYSLLVDSINMPRALQLKGELLKERETQEAALWCEKCGNEDLDKEIAEHKFSSVWFLILGVCAMAVSFFVNNVIFFWVFLLGGFLSIVQFFRGHKETIYTCRQCGHEMKRMP